MNAKKQYTRFFKMFAIAWLLTAICLVPDLHAAAIATLRAVAGSVDIMRGGALPAVPARNGEQVSSGDLVRTKSNGFAEVVYGDGTVLRISQRSRVDIGEHFSGNSPNSGGVRLTRGKVQAIVDLNNVKSSGTGPKKFEIRTPNAIAGVRGTDFYVSHERSTTGIMVKSGTVYSFNPNNPGRIVTLTPWTVTTITGRHAPAPPRPAMRQEIQRMEQGMTQPSSSSGGGAGGGAAAGGGTGGGAPSGGQSGGSSSFADATLPTLPAGGGPGSPQTLLSTIVTGHNPITDNGTPPPTHSEGQTAPPTSSSIVGGPQIVTQNTPTTTTIKPPPTNVNIGIHF
jgi:hypothetical protein